METDNREFIYIMKLWVTALLLSPVLQIMTDHPHLESFWMWVVIPFFFAFIGAIFSVASALILWLITLGTLRYSGLHWAIQKFIWSVAAGGLSLLPFLLIDNELLSPDDKHEMTIIYGTVIIAGIWIYKLKPYPKVNNEYILDEGHPVH